MVSILSFFTGNVELLPEMNRLNNGITFFILVTFNFFVFYILLNIYTAILIDAFQVAKFEADEKKKVLSGVKSRPPTLEVLKAGGKDIAEYIKRKIRFIKSLITLR